MDPLVQCSPPVQLTRRDCETNASVTLDNTSNVRFPHIDGLRAVAAFSVVVFHIGTVGTIGQPGDRDLIASASSKLLFGVTIFFVISGFVLYRPYVAAAASNAPRPLSLHFWERRFRRIVPAYWVALAVTSVAAASAVTLSPRLWVYPVFLQTYDNDTLFRGLSVAWTLCVEVAFYAALPLYAYASRRWCYSSANAKSRLRAEIGLLCVASAIALALRVPASRLSSGGTVLLTTMPLLFFWFALGMGLAVVSVYRPSIRHRRTKFFTWGAWLLGVALAESTTVLGTPASSTFLPTFSLPAHVMFGVAAALLLASLTLPAERDTYVHRLLATRAFVWLGTISYGVYLWHFPLVEELHRHGASRFVVLVVAVPGATLAGALSYYLVERRFMTSRSTRLHAESRSSRK